MPDKRLRILHMLYDHARNPWVGGGGAVRAREILSRLAARHDITLVSGLYPGAKDYDEGGVKCRFIGTDADNYALSTFCYAAKAWAYLKKHSSEYDIVIEDFAPYNPVFAPIFSKAPYAIQLHHKEGMNLLRKYFVLGIPFYISETFYPRFFKNIVTVSPESMRKFRVPTASVITNGIDAGLLKMPPTDGTYAAFLGRLHIDNKGLDTLIEAMAGNSLELRIGGKGPDEEMLKEMIEKKGVASRVRLSGFMDERKKNEFLQVASFLVLPSRYEGQGIVVLEAAALGKPVIVSNIPELRFAVEAGFGLSFPAGDAKSLNEKMKLLASDRGLRQEMSAKARNFAKAFTWERVSEEFEDFLIKASKNHRP